MAAKLALFDCDGTLVDSQANHRLAMEAAFGENGLAAPSSIKIRRVIGLSLPESMRILAPDADPEMHANLTAGYMRGFHAMRGQGLVDEPLYEGIRELLDSLAGDGWLLGIATGKSDRGLHNCLEQHRIKHMFASLQAADRHPSKPHPAMALKAMDDAGVGADRTIVIGDTSFDMEMGRAAGCRTIGVTWGYHSARELRRGGGDIIAGDIAALGAALNRMAEEMA